MKLSIPTALLVASCLTLSACGGESETVDDVASDEAGPGTPVAEPRVELPRTASPEGARVFFISPADGDTVSNPIAVEFGVEGMSVVTAGDPAPASGHHHLIVDAPLPNFGLPIPATDNYIHFGDGSSSTEITLEPGSHTLQLLFADHLHIPHDPPVMSATITITVE